MRIFRSADHKRMPWKNGGGVTTEIAVSPDGASVDNFDWRLSMATVASGGPFSVFAGIDRTLAVLDGDGLSLTVEGMGTTNLTTGSAPLPFPGDAPTGAELLGGTVTDLNIMTRRGRLAHTMRRLDLDGTLELSTTAPELIIFCHAGACQVTADDKNAVLNSHDAVYLAGSSMLRFEAQAPSRLFVIELAPAGPF
ncbi:HutD/Ves family protein [Pseudaminobacter soli (ex Li et al. 2025)]|uniref:HutD/Ves family protein n=1 Tax=Pseudaminobacter soli (ex Li et al. 2025) TaxID=1295366 RepID=UPI0024734BF4|nr:HutD family protein [Mesorhizobium soli]